MNEQEFLKIAQQYIEQGKTYEELAKRLTITSMELIDNTRAGKELRNKKIKERFDALKAKTEGLATDRAICLKLASEFNMDYTQIYRIVKKS